MVAKKICKKGLEILGKAKVRSRIGSNAKKLLIFIKNNKVVVSLGTVALVGSRTFFTFEELARFLADSSLLSIASKQLRKRELLNLLKELQTLPQSEFPILVSDLDLSNMVKVRRIEIFLGCVENISNSELKNHLIISIVTTLTKLYFSNSNNLNTLVQALLNALKGGFLSRRLFDIIIRMLINRGVPIEKIIEVVSES